MQIFRLAHLQGHAFAFQRGRDHAGRSFEGKLIERTGHLLREARKTARAIPAHLRFATIGVVITHPEIGAVRSRLEQEHTVRSDPAMPIAELRDLLALQLKLALAIIEHDEVIARAVHLREMQGRHGGLL